MTSGDYLVHSFNSTEAGKGNFVGLTKREYFAAMAMQGMLANNIHSPHPARTINGDISMTTSYAVQFADALLSELNKTI